MDNSNKRSSGTARVAQEVADLLDSLLRIGALNPNLIVAESICNAPPAQRGTITKATEVIGESQ